MLSESKTEGSLGAWDSRAISVASDGGRTIKRRRRHARNAELEGLVRVPVLCIQRPRDEPVDLSEVALRLVCNVPHDGVDLLALVVPLLALDDVVCRHSSL